MKNKGDSPSASRSDVKRKGKGKNSIAVKSPKPKSYVNPRAKKLAFLSAYAKIGTITHAAAFAGVERQSHYDWIANDDADGSYRKAFDAAAHQYADRVRDAVSSRAIDGWDEPVVYQGQIQKQGQQTVVVRKFSDRLLELLAKAKCGEFREKLEHSGTVSLEALLTESRKPDGG